MPLVTISISLVADSYLEVRMKGRREIIKRREKGFILLFSWKVGTRFWLIKEDYGE